MKKKNIHTRINFRTNIVNKGKVFCYTIKKVFETSFCNGEPLTSDAPYSYERFPNYNNHSGFYN